MGVVDGYGQWVLFINMVMGMVDENPRWVLLIG
jgi:hypothetical protein